MPTLGEKMWSGTTNVMLYEQFQQLAENIGVAPGTSFPVLSLPNANSTYLPPFSQFVDDPKIIR
jgi:hypothetical protein